MHHQQSLLSIYRRLQKLYCLPDYKVLLIDTNGGVCVAVVGVPMRMTGTKTDKTIFKILFILPKMVVKIIVLKIE